MTPTEFIAAVHSGKRGDRIVYYRGLCTSGETCAEAWKQYAKGKVLLVQKRVSWDGPYRFNYLAVVV